AGRLPVIFTPRAVATVFILPLTVALNGRTVLQGASPLGQKLGRQVFDPRLSVHDDPAFSYRPGSRFADDEGVPSRRLGLIEGGFVGTFVYDLQTAGLAGAQSTGSASRALGSLPTPGYGLLRVGAGEATFESMVAGMKDGLIVDQLLGGGQGNVLGGEFGGNVLLGYRVQNGQITGRVKNTMIAGNIYEAFREVGAIGSAPEWVRGGLEAPHILVNGVAVSSEE
ncbi:MAG: metallopeptidase TldD-related protein, partial [Chloroflexi bacterium]|nr:metallopeptidase TldD-related protein [Chloroflexota bacterium]